MGGVHAGHKGFALALLGEALTGALSGFGRARAGRQGVRPGSACYLQLIDPQAFAGRESFLRETDALVAERALLRREQTRNGLSLHPDVPPLLQRMSERYGVAVPAPVRG